jgi:hypothetical protein
MVLSVACSTRVLPSQTLSTESPMSNYISLAAANPGKSMNVLFLQDKYSTD